MAFWRRSKGRHALGAAVTSIPGLPVPPLEPVRRFGGPDAAPAAAVAFVPPVIAAPPPAEAVVQLPSVDLLPPAPSVPSYAPVPPTSLDWSFPELHPPAPSGPRVELTFRDGTSASLDDTQARALDELAQVLTRRD